MKRGRRLPRHTPLVARTPLVTRVPLRAVSRKRAAVNRARRLVVADIAGRQIATYGYTFCERCKARNVPLAGHERLARAQGGDPTKPDMLLCHPCNSWCEDEPREAAETGWKISRKWDRTP